MTSFLFYATICSKENFPEALMKRLISRIHSIQFRLLMVFITFITILVIIFYINYRQIQKESAKRVLDTVSANTSAMLGSINASLAESETSVQLLSSFVPSTALSKDSSVWYFFYRDLQTTIGLLESKDYQYANIHYFTYNHAQNYFLRSNRQTVNVFEEKALGAWLNDSEGVLNQTWQDVAFENTHYYIYSLKKGDFYLGAFISAPSILEKLTASSSEETSFAITGKSGDYMFTRVSSAMPDDTDLYFAEDGIKKVNGRDYALTKHTSKYGFTVFTSTPAFDRVDRVFLNMGPMIIIISLLLIFIFYLLTYRGCIRPLNYLRYSLSRVSSGDLTVRMREDMFTNEYNELAKSFNVMVREIKDLRVNSYEEKLSKQQAENRYLRAISYPHFLLNNLNLINNFAYEKNEQGIHDVVLNLSRYLRYFITADFDRHTLKNDVESAKSYLNLNSLTYPGRLNYSFEVDEELLDIAFPPLVISTIVENCIKHGLTPGSVLNIDISLKKAQTPEGELMLFKCINNGPGFPEDVVELINSPDVPEHIGTHVGLLSIKSTLMSQYGQTAGFRIENTPTGATVSISIYVNELRKVNMI